MDNPEMLLSMMKADTQTKEQSAPAENAVFLMVNGQKIEDPMEITKYVQENMMSEQPEESEMDEESMKQEAIGGLNLD